jgi:UDP-glucose 4-epimerase
MKVLITGGAGFIGSHVVDYYVRAGHEVDVFDTLRTGDRRNLAPAMVGGGVTVRNFDVRDVLARSLIEQNRYDVIVHAAAHVSVAESVRVPLLDAHVNILGTISILEGIRRAYASGSSSPRLVFLSSGGAIYGQTTYPAPESRRPDCRSPYGLAKFAAEAYINLYAEQYGIAATILRLSNVYGPRQRHDDGSEGAVVTAFAHALVNEHPIKIHGDGAQTRDFIYVADVVEAIAKAASGKFSGVVNIGTGRSTSINELLTLLADVANRADFALYRGRARAGDVRYSELDVTIATRVLGFTAQTSLGVGLAATWASIATPSL